MKFLTNLFRMHPTSGRRQPQVRPLAALESLEDRMMLTSSPLPVLMVIADQQDFYYQEYGDTRQSLEAAGVKVQVAATSILPSSPHPNTGEPANTRGVVIPDLRLKDVDPAEYSAVVFVGGWGSSMYQYSFAGTYDNVAYNGDLATKQVVNELIGDFVAQDKYVTAICHGVTVLAWARVDGASPLSGRDVSVPYIGSPAVNYRGIEYGNYGLGQYEQIVENGGLANRVSGQYGDPNTTADDVVVDGRIITAENYNSAAYFGRVIAHEVLAAPSEDPPPVNHPPIVADAFFEIDENAPAGTLVGRITGIAVDPGETVTIAITGGNIGQTFHVEGFNDNISVAVNDLLDFETHPEFQLTITVTDNGAVPLSSTALVTIRLRDVVEGPTSGVSVVGNDLVVQGTSAADVVYLWSGRTDNEVLVWMNDVSYGVHQLAPGARVLVYGGAGNDQIFATDLRTGVSIFGEAGHDLITGGSAADLIDGGDGWDRLSGLGGDDLIRGGAGNDNVFGGQGNDVLLGGDGDDVLEGEVGRDILIGSLGSDRIKGGAGDDVLIGGTTSYDDNDQALNAIRSMWNSAVAPTVRIKQAANNLAQTFQSQWAQAIHDDGAVDVLVGGDGADLVFAGMSDDLYLTRDDIKVANKRK